MGTAEAAAAAAATAKAGLHTRRKKGPCRTLNWAYPDDGVIL